MPRRPKGFDPLASLFERPQGEADPADDPVASIVPETTGPAFAPVIESADSFFAAPAAGPRPPVARMPEVTGPIPAVPPIPPPSPAPVSPNEATRAPAAPDPVALAKALARSAVARAGPPAPARASAPRIEPLQPPAARPARPEPTGSRIDDLARRAVRPRTAEEVLADLARARPTPPPSPEPRPVVKPEPKPEPRPEALPAATAIPSEAPAALAGRRRKPAAPTGPSPADVQALVEQKVKGLGALRIANTMAVDQREVLRALWKAHRTRFAGEGRLDLAVGAIAVLDALDRVPQGDLVVAHALTPASDYLLWLDLGEGRLLAAFADARAFFVGR